ncbi:MAG: hypothetical protein HOG49_02655 [Candidatus Scalindua sp.]|nr:hypothetical protein [Candidatus Scalindua sp.]
MMIRAIDKFHELDKGVMGVVRAADVYALHVIAKIRNQKIDMDVINSILSENKISGLNLVSYAYTKNELKQLEEKGHFTEIGQQIIVATHTALESYLILKFREYYRHLTLGNNEGIVEETLSRLNFRCLNDFKDAYKKFFKIHIPSFDVSYPSSDGCNFEPENSWEALILIYKARNDIVHKGVSLDYKVSTLMDSWYPFDFVRRWVSGFDANFDSHIYQNRETRLYREYKERAISNGISI